MLKSIDPILTPDLLWLLASMGHGDDLAVVDANHPAARIAQSTSSQRLIQLPGMSMEVAIRAVTPGKLSRSDFYRAAAASFGVVQVGDSRGYGCFLIRKGVIS